MNRGPVVEVNLDNLAYNLNLIKKRVNNRPIFAVVKADAYGHGAVAISKKLINHGITTLGVAYISEAIELRESGIANPIVVFFDPDVSDDVIKYRLTPIVNNMETARRLSSLAGKWKKKIEVHINADTGMGRLGFNSGDINRELKEVISLEGIEITGLMSHFSDADLADRAFAKLQMERFLKVRDYLVKKGIKPVCHIANSAAVMTFPDSFLDAVRPGLIIYGCNPYSPAKTKPVMSVKVQILAIRKIKKGTSISYGRTFVTKRDSIVGVLPIGYADGLMRTASNTAEVIVKGKRVPVVGRVCMDLTMIDLTDVRRVKESDEVVIIGTQGKESISVEELAVRSGTIPYEVLTSLGSRNRRVYLEGK